MSVRWQLRPMGASWQGAPVGGGGKAYPDTNPFRSEREAQVSQEWRDTLPETISRKRKADSSPLKRIRNDKVQSRVYWRR